MVTVTGSQVLRMYTVSVVSTSTWLLQKYTAVICYHDNVLFGGGGRVRVRVRVQRKLKGKLKALYVLSL